MVTHRVGLASEADARRGPGALARERGRIFLAFELGEPEVEARDEDRREAVRGRAACASSSS